MRKIVGFTGYIGSGKTTAAMHLITAHHFIRRPFARPLKLMLMAIGLSAEHLDGPLKNEPCDLLCGITPRQAMQRLGTEWGRRLIHEDLWVTLWRDSVAKTPMSVVADDVRFANEAATIRGLGGIIIRIDRPASGIASSHVSETGIDAITPDFSIKNVGDVNGLYATVDQCVW